MKKRGLSAGRILILTIAGLLLIWNIGARTVCAAPKKVKKIAWANVKSEIYLPVNGKKKLKVNIKPAKAAKKSRLLWTSGNKKIATVTKKGKVSAKKPGNVTITCKVASQPKKRVKCRIHVVKPTTGLSISAKKITLQIGQSSTRTASVSPKKATQKGVIYTSSDPRIATVGKKGKVTAVREGTATITAAPKDGFAKPVSYQVEVIGKLKGAAKYIAHRGLSSEAPENTLKAFQMAGEAGFWGAETDVRKTKDGRFVLMHDGDLGRMCGVNRRVEEMTLDEIKRTPITGGNGYEAYKNDPSATQIPTLEEYLHTCRDYGMVPVIEIKMSYDWTAEEPGNTPEEIRLENIPLETMDASGAPLGSAAEEDLRELYRTTMNIMRDAECVFIDFDLQALLKLSEIIGSEAYSADHVSIQHLMGKPDPDYIGLYQEHGFGLDANYSQTDPQQISQFMKAGITVNLWTINDPAAVWRYIKQAQVPYFTTNNRFW